ncbi:MAG: acetoacetate--CoA ligase [Chloroflexota bacterium]|nr:acetoacetate--CoA ligase [Chloroflexota bacterium]
MVSSGKPLEGALLWTPSDDVKRRANITRYMAWLREKRGLRFDSYEELWRWSVTDLEGFWASIWDFFQVIAHRPYSQVLTERRMPGARWFVGAQLNYAEHALRRRDAHPAVLFRSEARPLSVMTYEELYREVASVADGLRRLGVGKGDRVVAYMPNVPETLVALLATASIGAIWSSCSPEFGARSVVERFQQIGPSVLLAVDGYQYGGKRYPRMEVLAELQRQLPTLKRTVVVPYLDAGARLEGLSSAMTWRDLHGDARELAFEPVDFDHPLWVLYSSGTTGLPKAIVHGHGGVLLEHLKATSLHHDLTPDDRFFWFTTTGWMMWNYLVGGLLQGATVLLYDGNPGYPDMGALWRYAQDAGATYFGASAPYIHACMKSGVEPGAQFNLRSLKGVGSTGAPLSPEGFQWVYQKVSADVLLGSFCGGTDLCTGFLGPCPLLPVHAGEIQCRCLGAKAEAYDERGVPVVDRVGELVLTEPMPSMPLFLWNDSDGRLRRESYFETFPGVWRHGDWVKVTSRGSCVIYGRSDATLKRAGVRMGTSEFYRVVEGMPEVLDSLVVDTGKLGREGRLILFLALKKGVPLDDSLRRRVSDRLRTELSPRHVPDEIHAVPDVPRTINGKKLEVPVKRILLGASVEQVVSLDALANPDSVRFFADLARSADFSGA